jgi:gluconolactonase
MRSTQLTVPRLFTTLPENYHYTGSPSPWSAMTRPGQVLHSFLESPFFDDSGNLWISDVACGRIFCVDKSGAWKIGYQYDGAPHAMRFLPDGRAFVADYYNGLGWLQDSSFMPIADGQKDTPFLGLSDMAPGLDGEIWITDSGRSSLTSPVGRLWRFDTAGQLRLVLTNVPYSNGVAVSPDGRTIYVAATRANQIWRLNSALPDEGLPMTGVFLQLSGGLGPDGLATNTLGWLAIAQAQAGRVYVTDSLGDCVAEIRLPQGLWTTAVVFAPDDPRRLYIVEAQNGAIYVADLPTEKENL